MTLIAALALLLDDPVQEQTLLRLREHRAAFTSALLAMLNEMERNDAKAALRAFRRAGSPTPAAHAGRIQRAGTARARAPANPGGKRTTRL
jgi:hypothetical protein